MFEFSPAAFAKRLTELPARPAPIPVGTYSQYLQEHVFDVLRQGKPVDLTALDFSAFSFSDVTPDYYPVLAARNDDDWAQGFNGYVKRTPAVPCGEASFF